MNMCIVKVAVTDLGAYVAGELKWKWLELPATEEKIKSVFDALGNPEEYFLTDWETEIDGLQIGEYTPITELNKKAARLAELDEYDLEIVEALLDAGYDIDDAIDKLDDVFFYPNCDSMEDVARQLYEDGCIDIPEHIVNYFDFEAYGRDLGFDGEWHPTKTGYVQVF